MCDEDAEAMSRERIGHRGLAKDCQARWDRVVAARREDGPARYLREYGGGCSRDRGLLLAHLRRN